MGKIAKIILCASVSLIIFISSGCDKHQNTSLKSDFFTIAVLPDTQYYSKSYPDIFMGQTKWIAENSAAMKLLFVVHEGDVVDYDDPQQWKNADAAISVLDAHDIPFCIALGNHDIVIGKNDERNTQSFNKYFGVERFADKKWYGGSLENKSENSYYFFEAAGKKIMVLCLEFGPRNEVLDWANQLVEKHSDKNVIVLTHSYLNYDDTLVSTGDAYNPHDYFKNTNDGQDMWEKFVRKHKNIFLVLNGHIVGDGLGQLTSYSDHNTKITQILANYQTLENGGNGWLRLMKFIPSEDKIVVETYSPYLKKYNTEPDNNFVIENVGLFKKAMK